MGETVDIPDEGARAQDRADKAANRSITERPEARKDAMSSEDKGDRQ